MSERPPVDLTVAVTDADGVSTRWASDEREPHMIPRGLTFGTQRMQGFTQANVQLRREIDREYVDLHLLDDIQFIGTGGDIAYQGRIGALPRSHDTSPSIQVTAAGYMSHAADTPFREVFVDRDLGKWRTPSPARQAQHLNTLAYNPQGFQVTRGADGAALETGFDENGGWTVANRPISEAWYDSGGVPLGRITGEWERVGSVGAADVNWGWAAYLTSVDGEVANVDQTINLRATGPGTFTLAANETHRRYAFLHLYYAAAGGVAGSNNHYGIAWRDLAVYGLHYLPTPEGGVTASDAIRYAFNRWAPMIDTSGVRDTTYPIPNLVFDTPSTAYALLERVNAYHLWNAAVYENRRLTFEPVDLTDYDWDIRLDDPGTSVSLQGDTVEDLRNGIIVQFTNVATGRQETLSPDDHPELRDDAENNPANRWGLKKWGDPYQLSIPTTQAGALEIGRAALAEMNQPKAPGSITCRWHVRDRAGHWQPAWKVRAGDRLRISSSTSLSDRPRVVHETSYDHDSKTLTIAVDSTMRRLDAVIDRMSTALNAANLS